MARIRTIKPEYWTSDQVTECSIEARLLFIGLLNFVDDGGRMPYSPKKIKGQIYPHDDFTSADVQRMVDELSSSVLGTPLVVIYEVGGKQFLEITGFQKHQIVQWATFLYPDRNGVIPENIRPPGRGAHREFNERSQSVPPRKGRERKGVEGNGVEGSRGDSASLARSPRAREGPEADAEILDDWPSDYRSQFADAYPHKVGMSAALDDLEKARGKVSWRIVMEAIEAYAQTKPPDRQWANPKTWIAQERWNDRPAPKSAGTAKPRPGDRARRLASAVESREREAADGGPSDAIGGAEIGGEDARIVSGRKPSSE